MKKIVLMTLLIILFPVWGLLYLVGMLGLAAIYISEFYAWIYEQADCPFDKKY